MACQPAPEMPCASMPGTRPAVARLRPWERPGCALDMWTWAFQPGLPDSLQNSRQMATAALRRWLVPEAVLNDAVITAGELLANAAMFGRCPGIPGPSAAVLTLWRMDGKFLVIEVYDQSPALPRQRPAEPDSISGRGLNIVDALSVRWGTYMPFSDWKCVYCVLEILR
jgi:hypothetical protein